MIVLIGPKARLIEQTLGFYNKREYLKENVYTSNNIFLDHLPSSIPYDETSTQMNCMDYDMKPHFQILEPLVSVTRLQEGVVLVRFETKSTEDSYLFLAKLLRPLESELGFFPYKDRLCSGLDYE